MRKNPTPTNSPYLNEPVIRRPPARGKELDPPAIDELSIALVFPIFSEMARLTYHLLCHAHIQPRRFAEHVENALDFLVGLSRLGDDDQAVVFADRAGAAHFIIPGVRIDGGGDDV